MASGRVHLQSIISAAAKMQNMDDETLDKIADGLARVDDDLHQGLEYLEECE